MLYCCSATYELRFGYGSSALPSAWIAYLPYPFPHTCPDGAFLPYLTPIEPDLPSRRFPLHASDDHLTEEYNSKQL